MCLRLIRKIRDFQTIFSSFQISQVVNNKYLLLLLCTPKAKNTLPDKWKRREMKKNYEDDSKLCWYKSKSITWNSLSWNYSFYTVEEKEYYVYAMLILKKNHEDHSTKRKLSIFQPVWVWLIRELVRGLLWTGRTSYFFFNYRQDGKFNAGLEMASCPY